MFNEAQSTCPGVGWEENPIRAVTPGPSTRKAWTNNITGALKINKAGTLLQIKEGLDNATINEIGSLFPPIDQKKFKEALEALEYNF